MTRFQSQFDSCTKIAVKREPVRLTGIQKEPAVVEKFDLMKELSK